MPRRFTEVLSLLIIVLPFAGLAQKASITGHVQDETTSPLPGISIVLNQSGIGTATDAEGNFNLSQLEPGDYQLIITGIGYKRQTYRISLSSQQHIHIDIEMQESITAMNELVINGQTMAGELKKSGYTMDIIETRQFQNFTADINQVLQNTPGIQIREQGGLGSSFDLSLNGLSGNQIRYFIDGIPMENFGSALTLNNYPVNLIKNIEVYKGVVPVALAADALGGAINITTAYRQKSFLDATYAYGSFNTHRTSLNGQTVNQNRGHFLRVSSFFNHSDNNYRMYEMPVYDLERGNRQGSIDINRFNNEYTSGMIQLEAGIINKKLADRISFSVTHAQNKKHYQHPDNNIFTVLGNFHTKNSSLLASANYQKTVKRLSLQAYILTGQIKESVVDTSRLKYNWAGEFITRGEDDPRGELFDRRSLLELTDFVVRSNFNSNYNFTDNHKISLSFTQNYLKRNGTDQVNEFNRSFESPNFIHKNILGLSYTVSSNDEKLSGSLFAKKYWYHGRIITQDYEDNDVITRPAFSNTGYGALFSWQPSQQFLVKSSFEQTYRIPESFEILGDGIYILPNPNLQPERSYNANLGTEFQETLGQIKFRVESNVFYRSSKDFIRFNPLGPFGEFENLHNVRSVGLEGNLILDYKNKILLSSNATWQNITDETRLDEGLVNVNYKSRIPNIPYFFGNARVGFNALETGNKKMVLYWNSRYVHEFFLNWENIAASNTKNIIPRQLTHDLELEYSWQEEKYNISMTINNLFDARVYDNFNIQKPGRAIYLKLRYFIND